MWTGMCRDDAFLEGAFSMCHRWDAGKAAREAAQKSFYGIVSPHAVGARHALALAAAAMRQVCVPPIADIADDVHASPS